jgi:heterodisulfide reductase subunit C
MIQQIVFGIVTILAFGYAGWQFIRIRRNIMLGMPEETAGDTSKRWKNVFLIAFGQSKMFSRWVPGVMHLFIYVAFLITQVELIEILIDGFFGVHRFFAPKFGGFYTFAISFIEVISVLAFVATIVFLWRRNLLKLPRFHKDEMKGWPFKDGNLILIFEILLLIGIFSMNGADTVLQGIDAAHYPDTGRLAVSSWFGPAVFGNLETGTLQVIERFGWWLHATMVFVFLNYLPKSKHLHIILAFPNTYYASLKPRGEMKNMPEIMNEVKSMMGLTEGGEEPPMDEELPAFGANDILGLSWKTLLAAYTCTECGRCTSECPANLTGKKLSPRKIMMDIRDRTEEVAMKLESGNVEYAKDKEKSLSKDNFDDKKSLFDYITKEEIHACTTCNACVEACPVMISPMDPILELRRYEILTLSEGPADWLPLFNSIENGGSAWAMNVERDAWRNNT